MTTHGFRAGGAALLLLACAPALALCAASPAKARPALERHRAASVGAIRDPSTSNYRNAAQIYAWEEGALYRLFGAPEMVSVIALQPGETLVSVAAGDTARWVIGDTSSGSGAARRTHVLVKPSAPGLRTNLVIATDRRVYLLLLESRRSAAMPAIAWTYPQDELLALKAATEAAAAAAPVAEPIALERLNFNYAIEGGRPAWRPVRAFDNGVQVFIEFPHGLGSSELPPLFVLGDGGGAELVNYRLRGRYYVVDRLFAAAELRLGGKRQQVVRISRGGTGRRGRSM